MAKKLNMRNGSMLGMSRQIAEAGSAADGALVEQLRTEINDLQAQLQQNAIVLREKGLMYRGWQMTPTALIPPDDVTEDEMYHFGSILIGMQDAVQWWLGDWANLYRDAWGHMYDKLAEAMGTEQRTLENYAWVARKVPQAMRRESLGFTHHRLVAGLHPSMQGMESELLAFAEKHQLSSRQFEQHIAQIKREMKAQFSPRGENLFSPSLRPKISNTLKRAWERAQKGDDQARAELLTGLDAIQQWLDDVRRTLD